MRLLVGSETSKTCNSATTHKRHIQSDAEGSTLGPLDASELYLWFNFTEKDGPTGSSVISATEFNMSKGLEE